MPENEQTTQQISPEPLAVFGETSNPFAEREGFQQQRVFSEQLEQQEPEQTEVKTDEQQAATAENKPAEDKNEGVDPIAWINEAIGRPNGFLLKSLDDIPALVKEHAELSKNKPNDFTPEELARIKFARENQGNWNIYDKIVSVDTKSLNAVDAMKAKFVIENSTKYPQALAEKMFEKQLKARPVEEGDEEFELQLLEIEGNEAKKWLDEKKESLKIAVPQQEKVDTTQSDNNWFAGVDSIVSTIEKDKNVITYFTEDNQEVNVPMTPEEVFELKEAMDRPQDWLANEIMNEDGSFDFEALSNIILKVMHFPRVVKEYYELGRVHQEEHTLGKQRGNQSQPKTGPTQGGADPRAGVEKAFAGFR